MQKGRKRKRVGGKDARHALGICANLLERIIEPNAERVPIGAHEPRDDARVGRAGYVLHIAASNVVRNKPAVCRPSDERTRVRERRSGDGLLRTLSRVFIFRS